MIYTRKFSGGGFLMDYVANPLSSTAAPESASKKKAAGSESVMDDVVEKIMDAKGLSNDALALIAEVKQIEGASLNPYGSAQSREYLLDVAGKLIALENNKEMWKNSFAIAEKSGGLSEMAVGSAGELYTQDASGAIQTITVEQYNKNKDSVQVLTVAELLKARNDSPLLAGNNEVFKIANNSVGMSTISNHIMKVVGALGKESTSEESVKDRNQAIAALKQQGIDLNGRQPNSEEMKGIQLLAGVAGSPTTFNSVLEEGSTQRNHADKAVKYIWTSLDKNAQNKLRAQSAINGQSPQEVIMNMLVSGTSEEYKTKVTPQKALEEFVPGSKVGSENQQGQIKLTPQELAHNDRLYQPGRHYSINLGGAMTSVTASYVGPLLNLKKDGEMIGPGRVGDLLNNYNYGTIVNPGEAFIGDVRIDPTMLNEMATTGEDVAKVYLPINPDGTPDLARMDRFSDAYKVFEINRDKWSVQEVKDYFAEKGFDNLNITEEITENGQRLKVIGQSSDVKPFLALPVISNSSSDLSEIPWMTKSMGNKAKTDEELMRHAFTTVGGTVAKPQYVDNTPSKFWGLEKPFRGMAFIAYRPEASAILSASQGNVKANPVTDVDISRNLNYSSNTNLGGVYGSAEALTQ